MKNSPKKKSSANLAYAGALALGACLITGVKAAYAYDLQANTIYANTTEGIYRIDEVARTASRVADANPSVSQIEDIAFDGQVMYGLTYLMQLFKLEPADTEAAAINGETSFALHHTGLASRNGIMYAAEERTGLQIIDLTTGALIDVGPYGLGAGEQVTDLAFGADGTLYATIRFNGLPSDWLGTIDPATGSMNLIGNTLISGSRALAVRNGLLYAMNSVGDLYTLNPVSGAATKLADAVLPGVYGMTTSPAAPASPGDPAVGGSVTAADSGGGSLSVWLLPLIAMIPALRLLGRCPRPG